MRRTLLSFLLDDDAILFGVFKLEVRGGFEEICCVLECFFFVWDLLDERLVVLAGMVRVIYIFKVRRDATVHRLTPLVVNQRLIGVADWR